MKRITACFYIILLMFILCSCGEDNTKNPPVSYGYNTLTTAPEDESGSSDAESTSSDDDKITVDTSWQSNYRLTFDYFIEGTTSSTVTVSEKKTSTMYVTTDTSDGLTLYYMQNGANVDYYQIYKDNVTQQHAVYENHTVASIKSRFMSMSETDEDYATKPNSAYAGESAVAGRDAKLYIQRGYKDGVLTATAYYYIDVQYGFCSKAQVYDGEENLTMAWELTSFSSGTVTNDDISIDLSVYAFEEVNA